MTDTAAITPGQILLAAASLIEEKGWTKDVDYDAEGRVCAAYAVERSALVLHPDPDKIRVNVHGWKPFLDAVTLLLRRVGGNSIVAWNDETEGLTAAQVHATLVAAAGDSLA